MRAWPEDSALGLAPLGPPPVNLTCLTCPDQSFWYGGGLDINPNDPCAYISSLGDASCGQAPGLGLGGFPLFGGIGFGCGSGGVGGYGPGGGTGSPAPGPCTAPLCSPFAQAGAEAAPPAFGPNAILQAFLAACAGNAICEVAVSSPSGSAPGASDLTSPQKKIPPKAHNWLVRFVCKSSPSARVEASAEGGAVRGAIIWGVGGAVGGEILDPAGGGVPGAALGSFLGGTVGAGSGIILGAEIAFVCSATGAY